MEGETATTKLRSEPPSSLEEEHCHGKKQNYDGVFTVILRAANKAVRFFKLCQCHSKTYTKRVIVLNQTYCGCPLHSAGRPIHPSVKTRRRRGALGLALQGRCNKMLM